MNYSDRVFYIAEIRSDNSNPLVSYSDALATTREPDNQSSHSTLPLSMEYKQTNCEKQKNQNFISMYGE